MLAFFHAVGIRLSDKHSVYRLVNRSSVAPQWSTRLRDRWRNSLANFVRWCLHVLSISRRVYSHCLLLYDSSYLVVLLSPSMILSLEPRLGQCGLWYYVPSRVSRCTIPPFVLWSYLDHEFLYPACPGVWSGCHDLSSAIFLISSGSLMPSRLISWLYFLMFSLAFVLMVCVILRTLFVVYCRRFSPFLVLSSLGLELVMKSLLTNYLLIASTTLGALCLIMSVIVSFMASMSFSSCIVSNRSLPMLS